MTLVVVNYGRKKLLPSEEKLKSSWKEVSGFVKDLFHIHDSREKRKEKCSQKTPISMRKERQPV